eukprot:9331092-Pyramimonas_sp.AAC.1
MDTLATPESQKDPGKRASGDRNKKVRTALDELLAEGRKTLAKYQTVTSCSQTIQTSMESDPLWKYANNDDDGVKMKKQLRDLRKTCQECEPQTIILPSPAGPPLPPSTQSSAPAILALLSPPPLHSAS